ncbi:MAG: DNA polymerase III subunit beta [Ignavibacteriaceae bacterium]|mgnify:CR=1 FL=1|jgi:DNA polymerase-3 subunit beta|nr:DNA polymerase III subunit beta [Ignavibacteriaceae bacterium]
MEFKLNSKELEKHLSKIIPGVPTKTPMTILENFLFEITDGLLTIYATDLEISLQTSLNVVSDSNAKIVVPAHLLFNVIKTLKDTTIQFKVQDNGKLLLTTNTGKYTLSYLEATEFPEIPSIKTDEQNTKDINEFTIQGNELKESIDKTSFAMSREEMRPAMMGTLFEFDDDGLRFVATDGHKLVNLLNKKVTTKINQQYIVPERAISVLSKILDEREVKVYLSKTHVSFRLSELQLITRVIGQKYPDYASVIPVENEFSLKINTKELSDAIKRMMLFSVSSIRKVKFSIKKDVVNISAEEASIGASGEENVPCEYSGDDLEIGFNSAFLNDILNHISAENEIVFKLHSPTKAVIVIPVEKKDNYDLTMLLMPVRLNN